jgi:hypothetical protein
VDQKPRCYLGPANCFQPLMCIVVPPHSGPAEGAGIQTAAPHHNKSPIEKIRLTSAPVLDLRALHRRSNQSYEHNIRAGCAGHCASSWLLVMAMLAALTSPASAQEVTVSGPCRLNQGGNCAASSGYPTANYGDNENCVISNVPSVPLLVVAFDVEPGAVGCNDDAVIVNSVRFCSDEGPAGVLALGGTIRWSSDGSKTRAGWEISWPSSPPQPPVPPPQPPLLPVPEAQRISIVGPCRLTQGGNCISSSGYPRANYGNSNDVSSPTCLRPLCGWSPSTWTADLIARLTQ